MVYHLRRASIGLVCLATLVFLLWLLPRILNPTPPTPEERKRDQRWVDSSPYWLDRQACRSLGLCGIHHVKWDAPALPEKGGNDNGGDLRLEVLERLALGWSEERHFVAKTSTDSWETAPVQDLRRRRIGAAQSGRAKILEEIPDYVLAHAPLVHLYSGENFWPADMAEHIRHMEPLLADGLLANASEPLELGDLGQLNAQNSTVYLTSKDDVESRPEWLHSHVGVPVPFDDDDRKGAGDGDGERSQDEHWGWRGDTRRPSEGTTWWDVDKEHPPHRIADPRKLSGRQRDRQRDRQRRQRQGRAFRESQQHPLVGGFQEDVKPNNHSSGYSDGPAVLVLVDKGAGILDAFWFFFYSYNLGQTVLGIRFGNHVGDWEHCMVRFEHGIPRAMFLSEHAGGKAYAWQALEKRAARDKNKPPRPVIYSAVGSHAMYASPGNHPYVLPFGMLADQTDKGPLWDPALNHYAYWYDYERDREEADKTEPRSLTPAASNPKAPTSWFHFEGYWGDDIYPLSDERQWRLFGQYHYVTGPLGPKFKNLDRQKVCQTEKCTILYSIEAGKKSTWYS